MERLMGRQGKLRTWGRAVWEFAEKRLDNPVGRPIMLVVSRWAIRAQYRERCAVSYSDQVWEYRWSDVVVMSDRPLLVRARPEQMGQLAGVTPADDYLWDYIPSAGDVVVDVGAGIGEQLYTLIELVGPTGRVFAVEPHPRMMSLLQRLRDANSWENLTLVAGAVADTSGTVTLTDDPQFQTNDIFRRGSIEVRSYSLDDLFDEFHIDHVDYMKINIEGAEALAVRGMEKVAPLISHATISCHDFIADGLHATKAAVRDSLVDHGFAVREHTDPPDVCAAYFVYASRVEGSARP